MSDSPDDARIDETMWHWAWLRERVFASWYLLVPLALLITVAGGLDRWFLRAPMALLGVVAFRLWDDVEDLDHDRRHHPTRVLCRVLSTREAYGAAVIGLLLTAIPMAHASDTLAPFAGAVVAAYGAYEVRLAWPDLRGLCAHVILLKVPALVLGLALPETPRFVALGRAITLYGVVGAYELLHDADARRGPLAPALVLVDLVCLGAGAALWLLHDPVFR
ncbi:hypothetical protein [Polyangium sp. 15x6]|uniref:hypothetical protein n=1 Tax=Polyangium sp. 15x6 TaxID=3042687 RepID=UPI00249B6842|nr:hypothetical protein [Polyangium sp. 15x6]MDI3291667.1 hypothetical protein [Polyangium sp. 15x6]